MTDKINTIKDTENFWRDPRRVEAIQQIMRAVIHQKNWGVKNVCTFIEESMEKYVSALNDRGIERFSVTTISPKTLYNFTAENNRTQSIATPHYYSQLACFVDEIMGVSGPSRKDPTLKELLVKTHLIDDFLDYCQKQEVFIEPLTASSRTQNEKFHALFRDTGNSSGFETFENVLNALKVDGYSELTKEGLFSTGHVKGYKGGRPRYFIVYRYSLSSDYVARMFCLLAPPAPEFPFSNFKIFYRDEDSDLADKEGLMETNGLIIGSKFSIYLFGAMENGLSLNLFSLPTNSVHKKVFPGLQMGADTSGQIFSSRVVFEETEIDHSDDASVGIFRKSDLVEADPSVINSLKNEVSTARKDVFFDGKRMDPETLKVLTANKLNEAREEPFFSLEDGSTFNPADPKQLPFDSALQMLTKIVR